MRDALVYAPGVALSPVPIAAVLLVLTCPRALANGVSFLVGWMVGVSSAVVALVLLVRAVGLSDSNPTWIAAAEILLGLVFVLAVAVLWARGDDRHRSLAASVDSLTARRSAGLGIALSGANPKVVALALGAALALAQVDASPSTTAQTVLAFTAVGALGVLVPIAVYATAPARTASILDRLRAGLTRYERPVLTSVGLLVAAIFLTDGLGSL